VRSSVSHPITGEHGMRLPAWAGRGAQGTQRAAEARRGVRQGRLCLRRSFWAVAGPVAGPGSPLRRTYHVTWPAEAGRGGAARGPGGMPVSRGCCRRHPARKSQAGLPRQTGRPARFGLRLSATGVDVPKAAADSCDQGGDVGAGTGHARICCRMCSNGRFWCLAGSRGVLSRPFACNGTFARV